MPGGIDPRIPWRRIAPRQPQFAVLDGDGAGRDRLDQGRKTCRQSGFEALQIGFRTGGEIERPNKAGARALPQRCRDQLLLSGAVRKAVSDRNRAVPQAALEGHHGRCAKTAERGDAIRLVDEVLPGGAEGLRRRRR